MRTMVIIFGTGLCGVAGYEEIICEGINVCTLPDDHSEACLPELGKYTLEEISSSVVNSYTCRKLEEISTKR